MLDVDEQNEQACKMWLWSCCLYDAGLKTVLSDENFDTLSRYLYDAYASLPEWFVARVDAENLKAGTSLGLSFTKKEIDAAIEWAAHQ